MCDYSLHNVATRPSKVGDKLMTTNFPNTVTRGFCAVGEPQVAVCLMPGTEVAFEQEAESAHPFAWLFPRLGFGKIGARVARFRQINLDYPTAHHDALEFANGKVVLVNALRPGQCATVLQLPASAGVSGRVEEKVRSELIP
jgi:hypothetical protein